VSFGPCALVRAHRVPLERFPGTSFNEILKILCPGSGWNPTIRTRRRCPPSLTSFPFELEKNAVQSAADSEDCKDAPIHGSFLPFIPSTLGVYFTRSKGWNSNNKKCCDKINLK